MTLFPHGAHSYDLGDRSLVSMSNNFAKFLVVNGKVYTQSSLRFFDREEVKTLQDQVRTLGEMFEMKVKYKIPKDGRIKTLKTSLIFNDRLFFFIKPIFFKVDNLDNQICLCGTNKFILNINFWFAKEYFFCV